ncbi:hypothetical protein QLH32_15650 [Acinetobacter corruptisaponis]|uniref:Uncharacterized protein n=1 Tax=Acinetobacter corruptisaponis TaxID=3045147 RepID=A0ABY8S3L2_9GAMM|nr:hypothetical protein [Acinetobacter sp. KCTC 92772]WHP05427.1 hypothetical protein QLH32_15650 [Acinetobacter sp. KCTC 92772]
MNVQQISEDQFTTLAIDLADRTDTQTLDLGGVLILKANDGKVLIQSAFDSKYLLITQN